MARKGQQYRGEGNKCLQRRQQGKQENGTALKMTADTNNKRTFNHKRTKFNNSTLTLFNIDY